jgi:hypothetical protein
MLDLGISITEHTALPGPMEVDFAHRVMQLHLECPITICGLKRQARDTLVDEKRMVLDSGRVRE